MSPLARRTPRISRGVRALVIRMRRENFLWGASRIHGELLKLGFVVSQATVSVTCRDWVIRPPRGGGPSCGTKRLRSVRSVSAKPVGYQTSSTDGPCDLSGAPPKVRDGIACRLIKPSSTLHPLWPYRSFNRADRRFAQSRCVPGCSAAVHPQNGTHRTWPVDDFHRIAHGHHRDASCPAFANGARSSAIARRAKRTTIPLPRVNGLQSLSPPGDPAAIRLLRTKLGGTPAIISRFAGDRHPNLSFRWGQHSMEQPNHVVEPSRVGHARGPNGTILLLASCPMSARPNQGIPDLRHQ
jgi:hypothetical protein